VSCWSPDRHRPSPPHRPASTLRAPGRENKRKKPRDKPALTDTYRHEGTMNQRKDPQEPVTRIEGEDDAKPHSGRTTCRRVGSSSGRGWLHQVSCSCLVLRRLVLRGRPRELYPNVVDDGIRREGRRTLPNLSNGFCRCWPAGKEYA